MLRRDILKLSTLCLGTAASGSVSRALLADVTADSAVESKFFNPHQKATVDVLAEMIIPTTDTPGAVAAGVPKFIATIVSDWYRDSERAIFMEGLQRLDSHCQKSAAVNFADAEKDVQVAALSEQEQLAAEYVSPIKAGHPLAKVIDEQEPFFTKLKELVVLGYYTSEVGAKQELIYTPVPGTFDGNFEFEKVGRQWIT